MLFSTTTCPPPGQSKNPASLMPFAFAIAAFSSKIADLLRPYRSLLDHLCPLRVLVPDECRKRLRRIRDRIRAETEQTLVHFRQVQYAHHFTIQAENDFRRHARRCEPAEPAHAFETRETGFRERWQ